MHDQIVVSCQVSTRCSKLCGRIKTFKNGQNRKTGFEWSRLQRAKLSTKKLEEKPVKVQANKSKVPTVSNVPRKRCIPIVSIFRQSTKKLFIKPLAPSLCSLRF